MSRRRVVVAALPTAALLVLAIVAFALDQRTVVVSTPLGTVILVVAVVVAAVTVIALTWRAHIRRTALRAHEETRRSAAVEHRRFLDRLDHELKNPITAIRAAVAVSDASTPQLTAIDAQTTRMARLVGDLRKLGELQTAPMERVAVDLSDVVTDAAATIGEAQGRDIRVTLPSAPWPLPTVVGDPDLLFTAVHNVVSNAVKYSEPGDTVEVRGIERAGRVVIEVADTGRGIPAADVPSVLDELARGANARDRPGSGLGLALVRTIVERHGGSVSVDSHEERGTRVSIEIPVVTS
ncbi:Sensor protein kinase WalK [Microbacterium oleivorans]|uniref:sensor histidine kinase n=1 Tax=Microbacterium oleivorans TaxID=273677 RepID=UPI000976B3CB|nr:HAMP domain-containing sensor histidine kinase [Microbacterium oleivorans]AZS44566.1 Sensor protein kinase WalK [Microbacterium oleivorans]